MDEGDAKVLSVGPCSDRAESRNVASGEPSTKKSTGLPWNTSSGRTKHRTKAGNRITERKGFSVQARRFNADCYQNGNPGPGAYVPLSSADVLSPSFSKRGAGGLASQVPRIPPPRRRPAPAPNAYDLRSSLILSHGFSRVGSSAFQPPVAVTTETSRIVTPAPNQYQVSFSGVERNTAVSSAKSVFSSRTGRSNPYSKVSDWPSPCEYRVTDTLTRPDPRVPFSCFKSGSARIPCRETSRVPGPGTYSPHEPPKLNRGPALPRRHYLCLSAPAIPPPKPAPLPGPGQYNIGGCGSPPNWPAPRAVFMSGTSRWASVATGAGHPGPGYYDPERPEKQSFLLNPFREWVPA